MKRNLTCILCPRGCSLTVESVENGLSVTGFSCSRGEKYAIEECTHPVRMLTSILPVTNRPNTMVSVKTSTPIPKEHLLDAMQILRKTQIHAPAQIGDVVIPDLYGAAFVITKSID